MGSAGNHIGGVDDNGPTPTGTNRCGLSTRPTIGSDLHRRAGAMRYFDMTSHGHHPKRQPKGDYAVGYARPPAHSRFQRGQSGNPRGRTKGVRNFATDVKATLNIPVKVKGGKAHTVSTQEAALLRLREKALNGDHRALDRLLAFAGRYNDDAPALAAEHLSAEDEAILKNFTARLTRPPSPTEPVEGPNSRDSDSAGNANNKTGEAGPEKQESFQ